MIDYKDYSNDDLLMAWRAEAATLKSVKAREGAMRSEIVRRIFPKPKEGTQRHPLGSGYQLKGVYKPNYKIANDESLPGALEAMANAGNEGPFITQRLIKRKPELSISEYKALLQSANDGNGTARAILTTLQSILTIEEGSMSLEIEEPKA